MTSNADGALTLAIFGRLARRLRERAAQHHRYDPSRFPGEGAMASAFDALADELEAATRGRAEDWAPAPDPSGLNACFHCGRPSDHQHGDRHLCCRCHVEGGSSPADWHPECMGTYREIEARRAESATPHPGADAMTTDASAQLRTEIKAQLDRIGRLYDGCFEREMDATKALVLGDRAEANRLLTEVERGRAMAWQATLELAAKVAGITTPAPAAPP